MRCVPVIFASNEFFVPYLSVMLASIMDHASYEIIILHEGISGEYEQKLFDQIATKENFSLRMLDVTNFVKNADFYTDNRQDLTKETYFRLLAPYLLSEYDQALYVDGDMIALSDIAILSKIDLGDLLIAGVRDYCGIAEAYDQGSDRRRYMLDEIGIKNPDNYYIAGLLLMNLRQMRKEFSQEQLMSFALSRNWRFHDQDILNVLTQGRTLILDARWNVLQDYGKHHLLPKWLYQQWSDSLSDPWIIHYGGHLKPWKFPRVPRSKFFWVYAKQTPFYQEIKQRRIAEWLKGQEYRKKFFMQLFFPIGSKSRKSLGKLRRSLQAAMKRKM